MADMQRIMRAMHQINPQDVTALQKGDKVTIEARAPGVRFQVHLAASNYTLALPPTEHHFKSQSIKSIVNIDAAKIALLLRAIGILRRDCERNVSLTTVIGQLSFSGHVDDIDYHGVIYPA